MPEQQGRSQMFCGRPGHPGPYMHECPPRCESTSPRSKEQCHKDAAHTDFHWVVREGDIEVWDTNRGLSAGASSQSPGRAS